MGHHHTQVSLDRVSTGNDAAYLTGTKHQNPVAEFQKYIKVLAYINDSDAFLLLLIDQIINGMGRIDIQTSDSISGQKDLGCGSNLAAHQNLLNIAAGELSDRGIDAGCFYTEIFYDLLGQASGILAVSEKAFAFAEFPLKR